MNLALRQVCMQQCHELGYGVPTMIFAMLLQALKNRSLYRQCWFLCGAAMSAKWSACL